MTNTQVLCVVMNISIIIHEKIFISKLMLLGSRRPILPTRKCLLRRYANKHSLFVLLFTTYPQVSTRGIDVLCFHYSDVINGTMASQITSLTIVYSILGRRSKKTSKLRVTGLCAGNSPVTGEFHLWMASNAENVSIWWRHHVLWLHRSLLQTNC